MRVDRTFPIINIDGGVQGAGPGHAEEAGEEDPGGPPVLDGSLHHDLSLAASTQLHGRDGAPRTAGL